MTAADAPEKTVARILRFLARAPADIEASGAPGKVLLRNESGAIAVEAAVLRSLARSGRIVAKDERVTLTAARADANPERTEAFRRQHGEIEEIRMDTGDGQAAVTINLAESPLGTIARYRLRDGTPFVTPAEVDAGEKLRADYTRGRLMPRLGANWEAAVAPGKRGAEGGLADLTDAALAARQRVDRALTAVGPELAGVLIDVCCFLKGLELVERERGWPVRSAKVVLKTALGALSRHYRPPSGRQAGAALLHWGADDYRPELR